VPVHIYGPRLWLLIVEWQGHIGEQDMEMGVVSETLLGNIICYTGQRKVEYIIGKMCYVNV
jgi:hypothetical protein